MNIQQTNKIAKQNNKQTSVFASVRKDVYFWKLKYLKKVLMHFLKVGKFNVL